MHKLHSSNNNKNKKRTSYLITKWPHYMTIVIVKLGLKTKPLLALTMSMHFKFAWFRASLRPIKQKMKRRAFQTSIAPFALLCSTKHTTISKRTKRYSSPNKHNTHTQTAQTHTLNCQSNLLAIVKQQNMDNQMCYMKNMHYIPTFFFHKVLHEHPN